MKKFLPGVLFLCLLFSTSKAQVQEYGIFLGAAQYQGDLVKSAMAFNETRPAIGILGRYYLGANLDIRGGFTFGTIGGSDANYSSDYFRNKRNLSFRSRLYELSVLGEYNLRPFIPGSPHYRFAPYVFGGLALYHFNPQAKYNGAWVDLQPLGTEGQKLAGGSPYSLWQMSIPMGIGVKYSLGNNWILGLEFSGRKTFTDELDDVSGPYPGYDDLLKESATAANLSYGLTGTNTSPSTRAGANRGNPAHQDWYYFAGITITRYFAPFSCTSF